MSDSKGKAPSQIFTWFEKMKENYDKSVLTIIQRFEQNNHKQQNRIDEAHKSHINIMHEQHANQIAQLISQLDKKEQEISYFKQQIALQQQTISQLNNKYDKVTMEFIASSQASNTYKDIFDDNDFINIENNLNLKNTESINTEHISLNKSINETLSPATQPLAPDVKAQDDESPFYSPNTEQDLELEESYQQALQMRKDNDKQSAFNIFKKAATLGHVQAMGALGRAYFLAEGVEENPIKGLAWLINAANLGLPQAIRRVEHFRSNEPKLYQEAMLLAQELASECLAALV